MTARARRLVSIVMLGLALAACNLVPGAPVSLGAVPEAIASALADVCPGLNGGEGHAIPGASEAKPNERNHLVVLDASGKVSAWTAAAPAEWAPTSLGDAELVACLDADSVPDEFETCTYDDGSTITRVRYFILVNVYEAATGRKIELASLGPLGSIEGAPPEACPPTRESAPRDSSRLEGKRVDWAAVQPVLARMVAGEEFGAVTLTIDGGPSTGSYTLTSFDCRSEPSGDGTIWTFEAWRDNGAIVDSWDRYVEFQGFDGSGFAVEAFDHGQTIAAKLDLTVRITVDGYENTEQVRVAKDHSDSLGDGTFNVETSGGRATIAATGQTDAGVKITATARCAEVR